MPLLEVTGLTGGYGVTDILHDVSFAVEQGGITTILGANGAGKTSVLRALCGMLRVSDGSIRFAEQKLNGRATESIVMRNAARV
jgi:branched-chain amino acid transport system ATP-binding protein